MVDQRPPTDIITQTLEAIYDKRPILRELANGRTTIEHFATAAQWNPKPGDFPNRGMLEEVILDETQRLYGTEVLRAISEHFSKSWTVETGAHAHIPRSFDRASKREGPQLNPLIFQGQVFWALTNRSIGSNINISLSSGRVPPDNLNSGSYIDLPSGRTAIKTVSTKKYSETPQVLIPSTGEEFIGQKVEQLNTLLGQGQISEEDYGLAKDILNNFRNHPDGFSDQVVTSHALVMNRVLRMSGIRQVTLDSERVASQFIGKVLAESNSSIVSRILSDPNLSKKFIKEFAGIDTGWQEGESPFYGISSKNGAGRLEANYSGSTKPDDLTEALASVRVLPKGVFKFFVFMTEAGVCPVGGMNQSGYCTEIRNRASKFLKEIGEAKRAEILSQMPTNTAVISPCWGINSQSQEPSLVDPMSAAVEPLTPEEISRIGSISSTDSLVIASPSLYTFLVGNKSPVGYAHLLDLKSNVAVVR
ncbi:MAG: hypothetical protein US60_C0008G0022 [Microgenomates group bacterium GW2011_GWC1_37_8]|uniref:Uncharacterized protein n=1 Tax=Candidatus Woesebacteria bacterium GW2011_GWB1_38_8 TaxID=1618570 RepID=A0A0G0L1L4_9BACT|nr:MAG: hypothetical protein US60_C0008G0022 [Microgenomates group bacterium GW2011_GWC1_37_8]KKQ85858.1 MAG: hypothetical protein UT08_C0003G0021 [Candidatus Woesebacteria bacterium GW2011_GWB1_38_8]